MRAVERRIAITTASSKQTLPCSGERSFTWYAPARPEIDLVQNLDSEVHGGLLQEADVRVSRGSTRALCILVDMHEGLPGDEVDRDHADPLQVGHELFAGRIGGEACSSGEEGGRGTQRDRLKKQLQAIDQHQNN